MNEFLREYSPNETRAPRPWWKYILAVLGVVIVVGVAYYLFRDRGEVGEINAFIDDLKARNYDSAYARFGCSKDKPCRDYSMDKFMDDWGPKSPAAKPEVIKLTDKRSCGTSVIQNLDLGGGETATLIVDRAKKTIGFSPWKVCTPHMKVAE